MLRFKTSKFFNDMAKVSIKSEKNTPFGGIFHVREQFSRFVGPVIDKRGGIDGTIEVILLLIWNERAWSGCSYVSR